MQLSSLMKRLPSWRPNGLPREAFWELANSHVRFLYNAAYKYSGNSYDAEDLVQEALTIGFKKFHQLRDPDKFKGWMFTIVRNLYLKGTRKKSPVAIDQFEDGLDYLNELQGADLQQDLATAYEKKVEAETVQAVLNQMPEKYKTVLILYYMDDQSYQEISDSTGMPIGTVMSRLSRAKQAMKKALLRDRLRRRGKTAAAHLKAVR